MLQLVYSCYDRLIPCVCGLAAGQLLRYLLESLVIYRATVST